VFSLVTATGTVLPHRGESVTATWHLIRMTCYCGGRKVQSLNCQTFDIQIVKTNTLRVSAIPRMNWVGDENLDYKRM